MTPEALFARLHAEGLVDSPFAPAPEAEARVPWTVRALLGVTGWLGALFFIGFLAALLGELWFDSPAALLGLGTLAGLTSAALARSRGGELRAQFALALGLAGLGAMCIAAAELLDFRATAVAIATGAIAGTVLWLNRDPVHRFLCALLLGGAWMALCWTALLGEDAYLDRIFAPRGNLGRVPLAEALGLAPPALGAVWLWLEPRWRAGALAALLEPLAWALTLTTLVALGWTVLTGSARAAEGIEIPGLAEAWLAAPGSGAVAAAMLGWTVWRLAGPLAPRRRGLLLAAAALFVALTLPAPGLAAALALLLIGFATGERLLTALAVAFLLAFGAAYYYALALGLLAKSLALAGSGMALLALRRVLPRLIGGGSDAH